MRFPIMHGRGSGLEGVTLESIPWACIASHETQADRNHGQTLKRLAERGGLSPTEALAVLTDRNWRDTADDCGTPAAKSKRSAV